MSRTVETFHRDDANPDKKGNYHLLAYCPYCERKEWTIVGISWYHKYKHLNRVNSICDDCTKRMRKVEEVI